MFSLYPSGASVSLNVYLPGLSGVEVIFPSEPVMPSNTRFSPASYMATFAPGTDAAVVESVLVMVTLIFPWLRSISPPSPSPPKLPLLGVFGIFKTPSVVPSLFRVKENIS